MDPIYRGQAFAVEAVFTDDKGAPIDPSDVLFRVYDPARAKTVYAYGVDTEVTRSDLATYVWQRVADQHGTWEIKVDGAGAVAASSMVTLKVLRDPFD